MAESKDIGILNFFHLLGCPAQGSDQSIFIPSIVRKC